MQGKRTPTDKKDAVVTKKLQNPNISLREIEAETGVHFKTAWDIINRIPEEVTKSNKEPDMIDKLDDIINMVVDITKTSMKKFQQKNDNEWLNTREVKDLSSIAKDNFDRKQILQWKPTDIKKIDFNFKDKSPDQLEELRQQLLN